MNARENRPKQYAHRNIVKLDELGGYYSKHISAMTTEHLDGKFEIAAELAYRDFRIAILEHERLDRMIPQTLEDLYALMPTSWVELIKQAIILRDKGLDTDEVRDAPACLSLLERALSITDYCATCQGEGSYNVCGNIETCGCGQRERAGGK